MLTFTVKPYNQSCKFQAQEYTCGSVIKSTVPTMQHCTEAVVWGGDG